MARCEMRNNDVEDREKDYGGRSQVDKLDGFERFCSPLPVYINVLFTLELFFLPKPQIIKQIQRIV